MTTGYSFTGMETITIPTGVSPLLIDDFSLAFFLGFRNKTLWYALHCKEDNYTVFRIPKNSGTGMRVIHAPDDIMKSVLRQTHSRLLLPIQKKLGNHVTAYRPNRSIVDAVKRHIPECAICDSLPPEKTADKHECPRHGVHIHMDLKDFFHNTSRAQIRNYFMSKGYSFFVSGLIGTLLTVNLPNPKHKRNPARYRKHIARVPQGSPASGAICNIIADKHIDQPILEYLENLNIEQKLEGPWRWVYSRYADDLTFTCGKNFPREVTGKMIQDIFNIIRDGGYRVNYDKTYVSSGYYRKALGLQFHQKPNISKNEYLRVRAIIHNCLTQGFDTQFERAGKECADELIVYLKGKVNYIGQVHPGHGSKLKDELESALRVYAAEEPYESLP